MISYFTNLFSRDIGRLVFIVVFIGILVGWGVFLFTDVQQHSYLRRRDVEDTAMPQCPAYVDVAEKPRYLKGMKPYVYPVLSIIDVHDGDSGWVNLDLGFQISRKVCYRLDGLDTPEVTGSQKPVGLAVRDVVEAWLKRAVICESKSLDKYGRALVVFYDRDGVSLNDLLVKSKMALAYKGEAKAAMWSQAELRDALAAARTATTPLRP